MLVGLSGLRLQDCFYLFLFVAYILFVRAHLIISRISHYRTKDNDVSVLLQDWDWTRRGGVGI